MGRPSLKHYQAAADTDVVVTDKPAILKGIVIGADVAASVIEVSDSASDGDGNIKIKLSGATLMTSTGGYVELDMLMENGIALDIVNQTDVTVLYVPEEVGKLVR